MNQQPAQLLDGACPGVLPLRMVAQALPPSTDDRDSDMARKHQHKELPYDVARIRARCAAAGITPLELSRRAGVHHSVINRWLHGETSPTLRILRRFDAYLDSLKVNGRKVASSPANVSEYLVPQGKETREAVSA